MSGGRLMETCRRLERAFAAKAEGARLDVRRLLAARDVAYARASAAREALTPAAWTSLDCAVADSAARLADRQVRSLAPQAERARRIAEDCGLSRRRYATMRRGLERRCRRAAADAAPEPWHD